jgi:hypothetical protein
MTIPAWADGAIVALVVSAAVRALPDPAMPAVGFWQKSYLWFYNFTHSILANFDKIKTGNGTKA